LKGRLESGNFSRRGSHTANEISKEGRDSFWEGGERLSMSCLALDCMWDGHLVNHCYENLKIEHWEIIDWERAPERLVTGFRHLNLFKIKYARSTTELRVWKKARDIEWKLTQLTTPLMFYLMRAYDLEAQGMA
jgi:hypothetical protein